MYRKYYNIFSFYFFVPMAATAGSTGESGGALKIL